MNNDGGGLLGASSVILAAPVVAYGLGYAYYKSYFGFFGVDVLTLTIPIDHYFAQGVLSFLIALAGSAETGVFRWAPLICTLVLLAALVFPQFARFRTIVAWIVIVPLLASGGVSAFQQGQEEASTLADGPPAFVELGDLSAAVSSSAERNVCDERSGSTVGWTARRARLVQANECGWLRNIWQDSQTSILGTRVCLGEAEESCRWQVFRFSPEQFALTAIESQTGFIETSGEQQ